MTDWYVRDEKDPTEKGPLCPSELLEMVRNGDVTRSTMVRKDDSPWFAAGEVGGLFEAAMRPTIEYFCPQCKKDIGEPPTTCSHCGLEVKRAITKITENTINDHRSLTGKAGKSVKKWLTKKKIVKDKPKDQE